MKTTDNRDHSKLLISQIGRHDSIEVLRLSVRTANCLKRAQIVVIQDLLRLTSAELLSIQNIGRRGVQEIRATMVQLALMFDEEFYDDP